MKYFDNSTKEGYIFAYEQGGETVLLQTRDPYRISLHSADQAVLYYTSANCADDPQVTTLGDCCGARLTKTVIPDGSYKLWEVDQTQQIKQPYNSRLTVVSTQFQDNNCENIGGSVLGFPVSLWGTLYFSQPLRIERNPFIFGDDFSSANTAAWSNQ